MTVGYARPFAKNIKHILFVCTGNSCRSIMAEAYLAKRLSDEKLSIEIKSAGTLGLEGAPPTKETLAVLEEEGIDTAGYFSEALTPGAVKWADIILVMERTHEESIARMAPEAAPKVHYLGEFAGNGSGKYIGDPIGKPLDFYKSSFQIIKQAVEGLVEWLKA